MKNNIERNTDNIYISKAHVSITDRVLKTGTKITMHWHEYYEIGMIVRGKGKTTINDEEFTFDDGSLFFLTPVDFHCIDIIEDTRILNISFNIACLEDTFIPEILMTINPVTRLESVDYMLSLAKRLQSELESRERFGKKYISSLMNCILIDIYRKSGVEAKEISAPIQNAIQYIHRRFRENITLEDAAAAAGLSANYFSVKFHEIVGEGFKKYLNRLRLGYAAKLLEYTSLPVSEIAYYCGYNSPERFIKNFREFYIITPFSYRKNMRKEIDI